VVRLLLALATCLAAAEGTITFSDGSERSGGIRFAADLQLHDGKGLRTLPAGAVRGIALAPEREEMATPFRFPEPGKPRKEAVGEPYPVRHLVATVTLADGSVLKGHLTTCIAYVTDGEGATTKVVLPAKQVGKAPERLTDLVYPLRLSLPGDGAAGSARLALPVPAREAAVLGLPGLARIAGRIVGTDMQLEAPVPTPAILALADDQGVAVAWPGDDAALHARLQDLLSQISDYMDDRRVVAAATIAGSPCSLLLLRRSGVSTSTHPWRVEVWRWILAEGATPQAAARGYLLRGTGAPPAVRIETGWWKP
jgi:hypothetical protein